MAASWSSGSAYQSCSDNAVASSSCSFSLSSSSAESYSVSFSAWSAMQGQLPLSSSGLVPTSYASVSGTVSTWTFSRYYQVWSESAWSTYGAWSSSASRSYSWSPSVSGSWFWSSSAA